MADWDKIGKVTEGVMGAMTRDIDKPTENVLECVKADIALFQETRDQDDLVDALRGIHRVLENILASETIRNLVKP